jgi:AraC family ethanolamine operon transcriptional activator
MTTTLARCPGGCYPKCEPLRDIVHDVSAFEFRDFDSFREHLRGWDTEPVQLGAGGLRLVWNELRTPDFALSHLDVNRRLADRSAIDEGRVGFSVGLDPYVWCGHEVPAGSLVILSPGRDHRSALGDRFRSVEVSGTDALLGQANLIGERLDPRVFPSERCVVPLTPVELNGFAMLARQLDALAGTRVSPARVAAIRARTLCLLRSGLGRSRAPGVARVPRFDLATSALCRIDASKGRLTVAELAGTLRVTPRALEYAFESAVGVPPARYILSRRLNRVRRDILAKRATTVTAAASRRGFENLSRFAAQYRDLFGELPSETLSSR